MSATSIEVPAAVRSIQSSLARAAQDIPALVPLLDAFGPLFVERARLRLELPGWQGQPPAVDAERFSQGAFVLADSGFEDMSALLPLAVKALLPVLAQSFPALAAEFAVLDRAIESGALAPGQLAAAGFGDIGIQVVRLSTDFKDAGAYWQGFLDLAGGAAESLSRLPAAQQQALAAAVVEDLAPHAVETGYRLTSSILIASAGPV